MHVARRTQIRELRPEESAKCALFALFNHAFRRLFEIDLKIRDSDFRERVNSIFTAEIDRFCNAAISRMEWSRR